MCLYIVLHDLLLVKYHHLSCYLLYQAWYTDSYNYHDKGNVAPDYCYVLITVMDWFCTDDLL